ncbi:RNA polymerase III-inhibiting protein maf1 [Entomophthora muscae]|nr:RNA polymerase III-inhibiting protein maf1 [Entomophthora muscae]
METKISNEIKEAASISPDCTYFGSLISKRSPFGSLKDLSSRKVFYHLISTLNASFPDYEFSDLKPDQFEKIHSLNNAVNAINQALISCGGQSVVNSFGLWEAIDKIIDLEDTEIYSYIPDMDADPFTEVGCIWSFNYFFVNKKLKRIIFFTCRSVSIKRIDEGLGSSPLDDIDTIGMDYDDYIMAGLDV